VGEFAKTDHADCTLSMLRQWRELASEMAWMSSAEHQQNPPLQECHGWLEFVGYHGFQPLC